MSATDEYVSIDGFKSFIRLLYAYLLSKKYIVSAMIVGCAIVGLTLSFVIKPRYIARLTFVLQNAEEGAGGLSGLAGQFGLSLGGGGGTFSGDNIYALLNSRLLVEKALLAPVQTIEGKNTLLNEYIKINGLEQAWRKSENVELRELSFPPGQYRETFTRVQDSIIGTIYDVIVESDLAASKIDKKLSIGYLEVSSKSEFFSKNFVEKLIEETGQYYVDTKTKLSRTNYELLKLQTDSVKQLYDQTAEEYAALSDRNVASVRRSAGVDLSKKQMEMQMLASSYMEMKKNLELMKMTVSKQTPLVEVIDRPILPLEKKKLGKAMGLIGGGFLGGLLSCMWFTALFIWKRRRELL